MPRLIMVLAATTALGVPASAQSLSTLLPQISFPEPATTPSTKGCVPAEARVCRTEG
ncbi:MULTISPECIES: hypothetical protein [Tabrizicola]|uniref:hypothetical protein n=1 Tax=Tabrizicola TaxID=1443919 RepID=UPI0014366D25|nr:MULTISPECIES: hypothetical protein [Paracoccaceae]